MALDLVFLSLQLIYISTNQIFAFIDIFAFWVVFTRYWPSMDFLTIFNLYLLICIFYGTSAKHPPHPNQLEWTQGAFWKLVGSHLSSPSLQFEDLNVIETAVDGGTRFQSKVDCYSRDESTHFEDCQYVVKDIFDPNRLPQVIPTVTCLQKEGHISPEKFRSHGHTKCEEVKLQLPVLRKFSGVEGRGNYTVEFETVSVACLRTVRRSRIRSRTVHRIFPEVPS